MSAIDPTARAARALELTALVEARKLRAALAAYDPKGTNDA